MADIRTAIEKLIQHFRKGGMLKVFSFTVISTLVKMCTGFIGVKVVASLIGPPGVAILGQLNNFTTIVFTLACGGINNGVTKYIAEYKDSEQKINQYLSTASRIILVSSLSVGAILLGFHNQLSQLIMLTSKFGYVFVFLGSTVVFYSLNMFLLAIVNGHKQFRTYVVISIADSIVGVIFTVLLVTLWGLKGALISAVTYQCIMFFVSIGMLSKKPWLSFDFFRGEYYRKIALKYLKYSVMTLVSAATVPISQMILRGYVISYLSIEEAGYWEAINRLSNMYLMVITASFSVYYLPRLSELKDASELKREILDSYKTIIPILLIGLSMIYFSRKLIIDIVFSREFRAMEKLFFWQIIGDFFKIVSWLLAFLMIAKSMTKQFIVTEFLFSATFVLLGCFGIRLFGIEGLTFAYMINYVFYFIVMNWLFRKILYGRG